MQRWEYDVVAVNSPPNLEDLKTLDHAGDKGWEAFSVTVAVVDEPGHTVTLLYHLKRRGD